jgi:glycosyltransferase involved in cell wall biosynthesis
MTKSKVTVIIPTFKRSNMLSRAIDSVLNQTYQNLEIIVIDDNDPSSKYRKETEIVMEKYKEIEKVKYIKHECNKNGSAARNTGIKNSNSEYIAFLDDDDEYLPRKIELSVDRMETLGESWAGCYTAYKKMLKNNHYQNSLGNKEGSLLLETLARNVFLGGGSNLFLRRKAIVDIGGFDETFKRNQDIEFLVRLFQKYKIAYVDKCSLIIHYEVRDNPISYERSIEIDEKYLETFKPFLENLSENEMKYVYHNIALQRFKLSVNEKRILDGLSNLKRNKVSLLTTVRYIIYVIHRIIAQKSYGFNLGKR